MEKTVSRGLSLFFFTVLQSIITCPGCSVKEDRDLCPCILKIVYAEDDVQMLEEGVGLCLDGIAGKQGSGAGRGHLDTAVVISGHEVSLRAWRGDLDVLSLYPAGAERAEADGECWFRIEEGSPCPEIWTAHARANTGRDRAEVNCNLRKNHCRIKIVFNGTGSYEIRIRGGVCGYGYDGEPYPGNFMAYVESDGEGSHFICVPRQKDNSLMLDLISERGGVRSFAIGNYLTESGYDWDEDDLEDITVTIDYAATSARFIIDRWSTTLHFETVI